MNHHYRDIRDLIGMDPVWWDEYGVPRYCNFAPRETSNIYAREAVLLEIACQDCDTRFKVAMTQSMMDRVIGEVPTLRQLVLDGAIHYGDPPNAGCCPAGPTMNSVPLRVLEFWESPRCDWASVPALEVELGCEVA